MEIGTADIVETPEEKKRKGASISSGSRPGGTGGRNNGGGGDGPQDDGLDQREGPTTQKTRILTWCLLLVVMMTFGGLLAAYVVVSTNQVQEWRPFDLPFQVWISTAIILLSSFAYSMAERATVRDQYERSKGWLIATTFLGAAFISSQLLVWVELRSRGYYVRANPYAGFFYILTIVHAVHMLGGITALGTVLLRSWHPPATEFDRERRKTLAQVVGWYWHFMGMIWVVILLFLGYWK